MAAPAGPPGQPAPGRLDGAPARLWAEIAEVIGQQRLLKWSVPGVAHSLTFWGFVILGLTIVEAWGALFDADFHIPLIGRWRAIGFLEDFFAVAVLAGLATFAVLRLRSRTRPRSAAGVPLLRLAHRAAWVILGMISAVIAHAAALPGGPDQHRRLPVRGQPVGVRLLELLAKALAPARPERQRGHRDRRSCSANVGVILAFLVIVVYSKHLHIALAPINVATKRLPLGLGALLPIESGGKPLDFEDPAERRDQLRPRPDRAVHLEGHARLLHLHRVRAVPVAVPGLEHRQAALPEAAVMDLRDHAYAKAPYLLGGGRRRMPPRPASTEARPGCAAEAGAGHGGVPESGFAARARLRARPRRSGRWSAPPRRAA